jgi:fumarylacetoacetase
MAAERSWVPGAEGSGFGIENLPYGVVRPRGGGPPRVAVRISEFALDLAALGLRPGVFDQGSLNAFLRLGRSVWSETRARLREIVSIDSEPVGRALLPLSEVKTLLPIEIGDYVDFYSSLEHATTVGRMFRPEDPLPPAWRHLPIAYHGRSGTVCVSGTPIRRPCGQRAPGTADGTPSFGPEPWLDFELELGFVTGSGSSVGSGADAAAEDVIFGFVLVNDWSARQIQAWEYQPLGPFLSKSFATSISPWIVPLEALAPMRVPGVTRDPEPLPYLRVDRPWALDVELSVGLIPDRTEVETVVTKVNARGLYWNAAQQLAHATMNGASVRAGDLFASGTISGFEPGTQGCLLERSAAVTLDDGSERRFLEDGDAVVMRGVAGAVSFGEVLGRVLPAEC